MTIHGVLLDNHYAHLAGVIERVWDQLGVLAEVADCGTTIRTLNTEELSLEIDDSSLWHHCQSRQLILLTDNRSDHDGKSLESTIRLQLKLDSIPVVTPGDRQRLTHDRSYLIEVISSLADVVTDLSWFDRHLGIGRIFLPLAKPAS